MNIASPEAANTVMGSGYDSANREIQTYIDQEIAHAKAELGLTDADIIQLPVFFEGSGADFGPVWSNPVNCVRTSPPAFRQLTNPGAPGQTLAAHQPGRRLHLRGPPSVAS